MASNKFKPKASTNIIEGANPVNTEENTNAPEVKDETTPDVTPNVTPEVTPEETPNNDGVKNATPEEGVSPEVKKEDEDSEENQKPTVTFDDKDSNKKPIEKNVKVCTKVNHSCCIGGVRYHFEKGKQTNVPENVKSILKQADLLMPL